MMQNLFQNVVVVSFTTSAVIMILLFLLPLIHKKYTAKWRYWVWIVLAVRLLIPLSPSLPQTPIKIAPPSQTIEYQVPQKAEAASELNKAAPPLAAKNTTETRTVELNEILSIVWVLGFAVFMTYHMSGYFLFKKSVLRFSKPVKEKQIIQLWQEVKAEMKISQDIQLLVCKNVQSPMMTGFIKPILILPSLEFNSSDMKIILKHELIHYKRKDIWYKLLLICANAVHWFNPIVYMMIAMSNRDIEMACDSEMIKNSDVTFRKEYGEAILSAIHKGSQRQMAFSTYFYGGKKTMKERLTNIFDLRKKRRGFISLCILLAAVCVMSGLVACQKSTVSTGTSSGGLVTSSSAVKKTTSSNSNQTCTVEQALNLNLNDVDQIDISNGDTPQTRIKNKADIQELLKPFLQVKMNKVSYDDATRLQSQLENTDGGGFGLYYVIHQNGKPYMHMQIFQPNLIIIHANSVGINVKDYVFYNTQNPLDTKAIDQLIKKYKL